MARSRTAASGRTRRCGWRCEPASPGRPGARAAQDGQGGAEGVGVRDGAAGSSYGVRDSVPGEYLVRATVHEVVAYGGIAD
ncbi:hypothetical protein GCM10023086_19330 [Streptomyces venetus]|uniref:Uncharacterized protein n=1 Tax=Streptomyces venetus TaxID=1701086 RepID=A0ABP8FFM3_9ACTN